MNDTAYINDAAYMNYAAYMNCDRARLSQALFLGGIMTKTASLPAVVGLGALMIAGMAGAREQPAPSTAVSPADDASPQAPTGAHAPVSAPDDELSEVVVSGFRQ
jgi:hypothetical protein